MEQDVELFDLLVIGGGINGCGIARDAAGRGLKVALAEMNDLASATSSASTKLFHGGLRYLEYFEIRLVREALIEREVLLGAMPHISWPMRFVLPYHKDMRFDTETPVSKLMSTVMPWMKGRRPAWMIRMGLFLYDHLGGRKILPGTRVVRLASDPSGEPLKEKFQKAYEYSDCWVQDSRLVVLNARDAEARGARIMTRTKVIGAETVGGAWRVALEDCETGALFQINTRVLVNAGGPWVEQVLGTTPASGADAHVRLVRGSHIVTRKLFDHDKAYFFQGNDGRIIFAIPYEGDFTLIGTTDAAHDDPDQPPVCTDSEKSYLLSFASEYFAEPVTESDVVWSYSGVRPLYDDGASSATAATRDYVLKLDDKSGAPILSVFGGKITTYRKLAEAALTKIADRLPISPDGWTAGVALPGGDFPVTGKDALIRRLRADYPFLDDGWARRLVSAYGTESYGVLGNAQAASDLGVDFGATLSEREVRWLMLNEYARTADDILWRRSKQGLRLAPDEVQKLSDWVAANPPANAT
jgi:glycerol-3-phosphate dehydrogenase